jgi:hypothetical protein
VLAVWTWQLVAAMILNSVMQAFQIAAYAARVAGVRTGHVATAISLFSLVVTGSRTANMFYSPLIGTLSDSASRAMAAGAASAPHVFQWQMRLVLFAGTLGTALGAVLIPTFIVLYVRGIGAFNRTDSMILTAARLGDVRVLASIAQTLRLPKLRSFDRFSVSHVPFDLLVANTVLTAIYSVGVVAATYASIINPATSRTALLLSSIVNGFGTIAMAFVVDPRSASIVDKTVKGQRPAAHVNSMIFWLAATAVLGTLLSQLLLLPASSLIGVVAHLFNLK